MSNVRLSNGSPTLERMDARPSDHPKPSACRNLFGLVDHEELRRDLKGHLQEMEEASKATYNFDFANHKPLSPGRYVWEIVEDTEVPRFYTKPSRASKGICPSGNISLDLNGNHSCGGTACHEGTGDRLSGDSAEKPASQTDCRDQRTTPRKRSASHADSSQNKRANTTVDEVALSPNVTRSEEQTPSKSNPRQQK
ncbi:cyclin dependent kinase inhibitor 1Bb [Lepisosteus oculatus]|uniref:cyclin dependent kinase inhibitor 1Bb n=1 Tax=Lepisosteus oculatus TaxID=7918 RepID=UPI00371B80EF